MTVTTNGQAVNYHANVKTYHKPTVVETYMDDDGDEVYILSNGNTQLSVLYNNLWNPAKTKINWKSKGENPDKTKSHYK